MPFGYWVILLLKGEDIRKVGSGNIGATNVWRAYGRWYGIPIVLLDVSKGFVPGLVGTLLVGPLVALDVYEHAYFLDFQTDRASYIEAFFGNLDWDVVNDWAQQYGLG